MKIIKKVLIAAGVIFLLIAGFVSYIIFTWSSEKELANNLSASQQWQEIVPSKPLRLEKCNQYVAIKKGQGDVEDVFSIKEWDKIKLFNGEVVKPEIEIIDEHNNIYSLETTMLQRDVIGFSPKDTIGFPKHRVYKKVRIRSDKPFHCMMIWLCTRCK